MARKIEGRPTIEVEVDAERGMINIRQDDVGQTGPNYVELTHFDVPVLVKMLREAAKELKTGRAAE